MGQMMEALVQLVCVATGMSDAPAARITVITLFGQVLAFRAARATCERLFERPTTDPALVAELRARVVANTDAILDRLISEQQEQQ
jgi:hypothetical protein